MLNQLLLDALENERRYTAKELHDGVAQTTLQLGLQVGICRKLLERNNLEMLTSELAQLEKQVQKASGQVKDLIQDLRPPTIEGKGDLDEYIRYVIDVHLARDGAPVDYQFTDPQEQTVHLSQVRILGLARIIQEALLNVRKHANAKQVRFSVSIEDENLYLTITDDGQGFDSAEVQDRLLDKGGAGLTNLNMRTQAVGGTLGVARGTTGIGTRVTVNLSL